MSRHHKTGGRTAMVAAALAGLILGLGQQAVAAPAPTEPSRQTSAESSAEAKIHPKLDRELDSGKPVDFWIEFDRRTDLSEAEAVQDWNERGTAVAAALRTTAQQSQRGVQARLRAQDIDFESFWATNAIKVHGADSALATQLASQAEVAELWPTFEVTPPELTPAEAEAAVDSVEWGIANIKADQVWSSEGARGEGIVLANLDTGVDYEHPALVNQYRGNNGDGTFSHDYNWFDSRNVCGGEPCDDHGHGTHTMGTMVGDDGGQNHVGVAPAARWIATNGCCASDASIIASAQWLLEPTDREGKNPRASMRPHIVNNSWGSNLPSNQPFLEDISAAWTASGIFGVWSNGNIGPSCATSGRPGSRTINYSVGAYDSLDKIASFSSRGAGQDGAIKPDIAAPGVAVRSSQPGGGYQSMSGTSMAAPHVAGAIALLWSARPTALGDTTLTRELLDRTAIDTSDLSCGGTAENNNVYGEGRLDALALLAALPSGPAGELAGTVTDGETGAPLAGVQVNVAGPMDRSVTTQRDGRFGFHLPVGTYDLTATRFGYEPRPLTGIEVTAGAAVEKNVGLVPLPSARVSGTVSDDSGQGWPLYARVKVDGTPVTTHTDPATGAYSLHLPVGSDYSLTVDSLYPGYGRSTSTVSVAEDGSAVVDDHRLTTTDCDAALGYAADCTVQPGGLVVGHVTDAQTGAGVADARVHSVDAPDDNATTSVSKDDPTHGAGIFWMFSSLTGERAFTARKGSGYTAGTTTVDVREHTANRAEFALGAGRLEVTQEAVSGTVELGGATTRDIEVRNVGSAPATFELTDQDEGFRISRADGSKVSSVDVADSAGPKPQRIEIEASPLRGGQKMDPAGAGAAVPDATGVQEGPWLDLADHPVPVMDNIAGYHDGIVYSFGGTRDGEMPTSAAYAYDPESLRWNEMAAMPQARMKPGGAFVDGRFYVIGGWGAPGSMVDGTAIYDPETDSWSAGADNPQPMAAAGVAALDRVIYSVGGCVAVCGSRAVMAYDVEADSFSRVADYPVPTAWLACGALGEKVVCSGGIGNGTASRGTYAYDPEQNSWTQVADMPRAVWGAGYTAAGDRLLVSGGIADDALTNAGWAYDPVGDAWTSLPNSQHAVYRGGSACGFAKVGGSAGVFAPAATAEVLPGYDDCGGGDATDASWLSTAAGSVTLAPGESATVTLTLDSGELGQPGEYAARLRLTEDTPFDVPLVSVSLRVDPPRTWGKILGTVSGAACAGEPVPLEGATVSLAGSTSTWTVTVPADGGYARWIDRGQNPVRVTAHKDGFVPGARTTRVGKTPVREDFVLARRTC
ncbi:S8 family serine peptidase [Nocardioides sp. CCNWLW239]|uniref:S8 family serine peptidase n=1 Tax=Nocardioides sp. CCNWLW239 TaxID=3128902 RepID=UPI00301ADFE1